MLHIKGICLLLSHLPTSHTTTHADPHVVVPYNPSLIGMILSVL